MSVKKIGESALNGLKNRAVRGILNPITGMVDEQLTDITTTIGAFIIRSIRGKFQRSITFTVGVNYSDNWMEEALYGVLYEHNKIKTKSKLELSNKKGINDGTGMYYRLDDGTHSLKYRDYDILLFIQTRSPQSPTGRVSTVRSYTIICYDLNPEFVTLFEKDMIRHRNALLEIRKDSPTVNVYQDLHESDGYTYWEKVQAITKRKLDTIYLPYEQKKLLVDTINTFFASREMYQQHGIPWNLKILLYGPPGTGKSSIVKMIASEWNRNLFECTGGKNGKFIPNAITDHGDQIIHPLFSISDIDKYPSLINEPDIDMNKENAKDEMLAYKQTFSSMINALDGILSGEGRIIIMTTNHIEKFSPTILRPGRVDLKMEIGYVTVDVFRKYVHDFYQIDLPKDIKLNRKDITIADMQSDVVFMRLTAEEFIKKYTKASKDK